MPRVFAGAPRSQTSNIHLTLHADNTMLLPSLCHNHHIFATITKPRCARKLYLVDLLVHILGCNDVILKHFCSGSYLFSTKCSGDIHASHWPSQNHLLKLPGSGWVQIDAIRKGFQLVLSVSDHSRDKIDQVLPLRFVYCKQSKTGRWEGLGMRLG